uniref:Putative secreted protein n=1 Tax=Ixodes ricinus TaxID=34613 RepID=A0A6B0URY9_IXORI
MALYRPFVFLSLTDILVVSVVFAKFSLWSTSKWPLPPPVRAPFSLSVFKAIPFFISFNALAYSFHLFHFAISFQGYAFLWSELCSDFHCDTNAKKNCLSGSCHFVPLHTSPGVARLGNHQSLPENHELCACLFK